MHNFGIISDLNVHYLYNERQHQECVNAKKHGAAYNAGKFVLETILKGLSGAWVVIKIVFIMLAFTWPLLILAGFFWPATAAVFGLAALAYLTFKAYEGIRIYNSQKPYYKPPIPKYQKLIKRNKKPFGAKLTDFFRN